MAAILKSKMAAKKRKFQPGKLPTTILVTPRNIMAPFASFYPKCLADLIFRPQFGFCPLTNNNIVPFNNTIPLIQNKTVKIKECRAA